MTFIHRNGEGKTVLFTGNKQTDEILEVSFCIKERIQSRKDLFLGYHQNDFIFSSDELRKVLT